MKKEIKQKLGEKIVNERRHGEKKLEARGVRKKEREIV